MKKAWLAYASLALLSVLIGLMLAGGPGALGATEQPDRFPPFTASATSSVPGPDAESSTNQASISEPEQSPEAVSIGVVNASGSEGRADETVRALAELGFDDPVTLSTADFSLTVVFFSVDMRSAAAELATGLGLPADAVLPASQLPDLATDENFDLVVMLGTDSA